MAFNRSEYMRNYMQRYRKRAKASARCAYCGEHVGGPQDHIIPATRGGSEDPENLTTCCQPCNASKGAKTLPEWFLRGGWDRLDAVTALKSQKVCRVFVAQMAGYPELATRANSLLILAGQNPIDFSLPEPGTKA